MFRDSSSVHHQEFFTVHTAMVYVIQFCWQLASSILLASCQQTCMTYTIAVCTVKNSWWWREKLSETCRVSVEIPTRCSFVTEFIIPKLIEGSTCFERHTAHHQELKTVFAASGLYTNVLTGRWQGWVIFFPTQPWQRPVTTCVYKPEAANTV